MFLKYALIFLLCCYGYTDSLPQYSAPSNVTVTFISALSVKVSWDSEMDSIEKHEVTYKPTEASYRVVAVVAANSNSVTLNNLMPNTQYQLSVTAVKAGKKYRSRPVVFRTLDAGSVPAIGNDSSIGQVISLDNPDVVSGPGNAIPPLDPAEATGYIQVRGIEVAIVVLVLLVWVGAIILFFNRWGKIRMLIPYQPDYKETQLKVPGTGACSNVNTCPSETGQNFCCSQSTTPECSRKSMDQSLYWCHSSPADLHYSQAQNLLPPLPPPSAIAPFEFCTIHHDQTCPNHHQRSYSAVVSVPRRNIRKSYSEDNIATAAVATATNLKHTLLKYRRSIYNTLPTVSVSMTSADPSEQTDHQLV